MTGLSIGAELRPAVGPSARTGPPPGPGAGSDEAPVLAMASARDALAEAVVDELEGRGVPVTRLDPGDFPTGWDLGWSMPSGPSFVAAPHRVSLSQLRSALVRPGAPRLDHVRDEDRDYVAAEVSATLLGVLAGLSCPVVNRPRPGHIGRAVLRAPGVLRKAGLELAPTLIGWQPEETLDFYRRVCHQRALLGSVSGRTPARTIEGEVGADRLAAGLLETIVLQALPAGPAASVMVMGSQAITLSDRELRPGLLEACVRAAAALELRLARFDLVLSGERAVCLEVSEHPELPTASERSEEVVGALCELLAATGSSA